MDLGIKGRVALVTGGSRGLGRQSALSLAREGVKVAICARTEETLNRTVGELRALGTEAMGVVADISDSAAPKELHRKVVAQLGPVDILVNNVGGSRGSGDILDITEEQIKETFDLNVYGALRLIHLAIPDMRARKWGRIINIASINGREMWRGRGAWGSNMPSITAKAALIAMTKAMAIGLAKDGILVNTVAPGSITFPGGSWERFQKEQPPQVVQGFIEREFPMGKFGWPEPIGDLVAFLASERASLITGTSINIDGGQSRSMI